MKKIYLLLLFLTSPIPAQTIVNTFSFPQYTYYNYMWGITQKSDTFWIASDYTPSTSAFAKIYKVTKSGTMIDSIYGPIHANKGIEFDGTNFWLAGGYLSTGVRIYKMSPAGALLDSFQTRPVQGSTVFGVGDLALDGNKMWYSVFSPDFVSYPNGWAYAFDINTKEIVDSIPLRGRQVTGIAVKGDTIFYANDNQYTGDIEKIYAYSKTTGDTVFSFRAPDPDGECNPRGLYWDGIYLNLVAERIGPSNWYYKTVYQYSITGTGNPIITLAQTDLDFGSTVIGQSGVVSLNISNSGTANLIISNLEFSNNVFSSPAVLPDTILPGYGKSYTLYFTPAQYDSAFSDLNIYSNDGASPVKTVHLRGKGIYSGAYISVSGTSYNYGARRINSKCGWLLNLLNAGNQNLIINSASFAGSTYSLDTTGITLPLTIAAQQERTFRVWFSPQSNISYDDSLLINSNAVNNSSIFIHLTGTGEQRSYAMGEILWSGNVPFNPHSYTNDYQPASMKRLPDVNGDGVDEVVAASENYLVTCYNGNSSVTADILWSFDTGYNDNNSGSVMYEDALQIRTDVDGDGVQDVVFGCGGGNEFVYTVSGRTGRQIWAYGDSINWDLGNINGLRADKDYNNDGVNDVLVSASGSNSGGRHAAICLNGLNGAEIFNAVQPANYTFDITTTDLGGIITVDHLNGGPYYLNAFNNQGTALWSVGVPDVVWSMRQIKDINNDGVKDFVGYSGGMDVNSFARDGVNGSLIWNNHYPLYSTFSTIRLISDLQADGYEDMIFSGKEGVFRTDTKTGSVMWSNTLDASYVFGTDELGDLNSDGINEIAAGTKNANLYILDGQNGNVLNQYSFGVPISEAVERVINTGNVDENYSDDFTAGSNDGRIICFSGGLANPVPVNLVSFKAEIVNKVLQLKWSTATEVNNSGFRILVNNKQMLFVKGHGTSSERNSYSAEIKDLPAGKYNLKLMQIDLDGSETLVAETDIDFTSPSVFALYQNYPNPFNPSTKIKYDVPFTSRVEMKIYDIIGNEVASLVDKEMEAGSYELQFNAASLSSGIYFCRMNAYIDGGNAFSSTKKITVLK